MKPGFGLVTALVCLVLCSCDLRSPLGRYEPPAPDTFTAATVRVSIGGISTPTAVAIVKQDFFKPYTVMPLIGRRFDAADYAAGAPRLALLSEDVWRRQFSAAPDVIGSDVDIDGARVVVIGVMPLAFDVPLPAKLWLNR